ncbi:helix-turn-helix domain-containing protein [Nocardia sp. BMG51109]|uniref:helix-turn-helix domain-containing protein n=1 Tax=Nocardia sp. BMG51109 TaxID=1056816 RepID=UPI0004649E63|nr:helix-turn-helix transcriptional regulator [Nocardia sp. BMG51109]
MHLTTGEVIRRIRKSLGMTQTELGAVLGYTQPVISQLEHDGAAIHDVRVLRRIAKALHVPLAILVVESDEEADVNRRNFLRASALGAGTAVTAGAAGHAAAATSSTGSVQVGATDVAEITASTNQIHELDLLVGGDRLCRVAANEVRYVEQLLDNSTYTEAVGQTLTSAAAEMMTAAGWVHYDAGRLDQGRRYYADAAQAATAAGDGIAVAHALGNASSLLTEWNGGTPAGTRQAVQYAQTASRAAMSQGGPKLRALMAIREADALGMQDPSGNKTAVTDALSRAYRAYESSRGFDPEWVYLPDALLSGMTGIMHMYVGEHKAASEQIQVAIDGSAAWPREQAEWYVQLGRNLVQAGEIAEGCQVLAENFGSIQQIASTRVHQKLDAVATVVRPHAQVPEVREFLGMMAAR